MKQVYFLSDAHLGSRAIRHQRTQERRLVNFLESIKHKASAIYLMGDIFDFWFEYTTVVPRGYTRLLGKLSELTDSGVEVHLFVGNHDLWVTDYLEKECGVTIHREPEVVELGDRVFFLAHGDGLGTTDRGFLFLRKIFRSYFCRRLFAAIHPRWGMNFGLEWAKRSRLKREDGKEPPYQGEEREELVRFAKDYLQTHPEINTFIFGHRHIELHLRIARTTDLIILGDWISEYTYAVFDGENLFLENFIEGETIP